MRAEIQDFKNLIEGQDIFIIGGGPSLKNFDFSKLKSKFKIALNSAFFGTDPHAVFWMDSVWPAKNFDILTEYPGYKFCSKVSGSGYIKKNIKGIANSTVLNKKSDYGFSHNIDEVCGNNSGAQCLNFVCNLKPHRILLLGYDMEFSKGHSHWHSGYEISDASVYQNLFIPSINSMAKDIQHLNISVINCNINSRLNCFKKDLLENYL